MNKATFYVSCIEFIRIKPNILDGFPRTVWGIDKYEFRWRTDDNRNIHEMFKEENAYIISDINEYNIDDKRTIKLKYYDILENGKNYLIHTHPRTCRLDDNTYEGCEIEFQGINIEH